jgi:isoleucyl-tRNA synthetase
VLETLTRVAAPLIPLVAEKVWQGLTGGRSVHLEDWPDADAFPEAADIRSAMDAVREVSSVANALRKKEGKRVRLPLPKLTVAVTDAASLAQFDGILRDELNVKEVELVELGDGLAERYGISKRLTVNARAAGPRLGKQVQHVIAGAKAGVWEERDGVVVVDGIALEHGEYDLTLEAGGVEEGTAISLVGDGGFVLLDTTTTPDLEAEGLARDVIRAVQDTRKAAGFDVSDRIRLQLAFDDVDDRVAVESAFEAADVAGETLAVEHALYGPRGSRPAEPVPDHVAEFVAGTYANRGAFTVAVTKMEASA